MFCGGPHCSFSGGTPAIFCQQITGSIVGTVTDQQGAVVSIATVKATNADTGFSRSAPTNGYGEFRIDYLPVGNYTVQASAAGFKTYVQQNVVLTVDQTQTLEITLEVGAVTQDGYSDGGPAAGKYERRGARDNH